jgi:hypothetical protein
MNKSTIGILILGLSLVLGAGLVIGGCSLQKEWWCLIAVVPALLSLLAVHGIAKTKDSQPGESCDTLDGWLFFLAAGLVSVIAVPVILFRIQDYKTATLALQLVGTIIIMVGYFVCLTCHSNEDGGGGW